MSSARLLIVSNRLPVMARVVDGEVALSDAGGGLVTGLRPYHEKSGGLWIGWPGDVSRLTPDQGLCLDRQPVRDSGCGTIARYGGFCACSSPARVPRLATPHCRTVWSARPTPAS
jgi:hypothetical protein